MSFKKICCLLALGLMTILCLYFTGTILMAQPLPRIVLMDFDPGGTSARPAQFTGQISSDLLQDGKYEIIFGDKVSETLRSLNLPSMGIISLADAAKLAGALNADAVIMGRIQSFDVDRTHRSSRVSVSGFRIGSSQSVTVKLDIYAQMVDTNNNTSLFSEVFNGYHRRDQADVGYRYMDINIRNPQAHETTRLVVDEAIGKLVDKVRKTAPKQKKISELTGYVLSIEDDLIVIDLGEKHQVKPNMVFLIKGIKEYKHPVTGETIKDSFSAGKLEIVEVKENISHAKLIEGSLSELQAGYIIVLDE